MAQYELEKPKQTRSKETREKIIETGQKLFCELGYHATSSKKIAQAAGIATGTFYNHFKDKKALLLEIHKRHVEKVHGELARFFEQGSFNDSGDLSTMQRLVELIYRTHELGPRLHREIHHLSHVDSEFAKISHNERKASHKRISEVLNPYLANMRISDFEAATTVISLTMEAVIHSVIMDKMPVSKKRILNALADMMYCYLFDK